MGSLPNPATRNPIAFPDGTIDPTTVFLNQVIDHPNIEIGDWTYYNDDRLPEDYAKAIAPYLFPGVPEQLRIGRFCQIARGVQFITSTANHAMTGVSTYPFAVFDRQRIGLYRRTLPRGRDTIVGNDCWIGREAMLLPGAELGNGVIVGAGAVVRGHVPDYAIVAGNPATIVRMRYGASEIEQLLDAAWWDWPHDDIARAMHAIEGGSIEALLKLAPSR